MKPTPLKLSSLSVDLSTIFLLPNLRTSPVDYLYVSGAPELLHIVESRASPVISAPSILKKTPLDQQEREKSSILVLQPPHGYPPIEFQVTV